MRMAFTASVSQLTAFVGVDWTNKASQRTTQTQEQSTQNKVIDVQPSAAERTEVDSPTDQSQRATRYAVQKAQPYVVRYAAPQNPGQQPSVIYDSLSPTGQNLDLYA